MGNGNIPYMDIHMKKKMSKHILDLQCQNCKEMQNHCPGELAGLKEGFYTFESFPAPAIFIGTYLQTNETQGRTILSSDTKGQ